MVSMKLFDSERRVIEAAERLAAALDAGGVDRTAVVGEQRGSYRTGCLRSTALASSAGVPVVLSTVMS